MLNHWPLFIAAGIVSLAAMLGLWQHESAVSAASARPPLPHAARQKQPPVPAADKAKAEADPAVVGKTADDAPVRKSKNPPVEKKPALVAIEKSNPAAPVPGAPAAPASKREGRSKVLTDLRTALQTKFGILPMDLAAGGFALNVEGMRVETQPLPNWSISVYNINPKAPEIETDNFKACMEIVAANLGIDMAHKPVEAGNGKTYLKTDSKLGSISLTRDPATANSCTIRPIGQWTPGNAKADNGAGIVQQPKPAKPVPSTPAAPPRPPATDNNF